jgi:hypothetical protein
MKNETTKICKICEYKFKSTRKNHLCCSQKCSQKYTKFKKTTAGNEEPYIGYVLNENGYIDTPLLQELKSINLEGIVEPTKDQLNEFHELTEKNLNIEKRKKRTKYFSKDIVDYILIRLKLDDKIEEYHPQEILNDLIRYNIIDLSLKDLHYIMPELVKYQNGYFGVNYSILNNLKSINEFSERLCGYIIEEDKIPTEEQLAKSGLLKMMTDEIRSIISLTTKTPNPKKEIFSGVVEMIEDLSALINKKFESLNLKIDKAIMISEQNVLISTNANLRYDSFEKQLQLLSEKIDKIKEKRRFFG